MPDQVHRDYSILSIRFVNHSIISYSQFTQTRKRTHKTLRPYRVKVLRQPTEFGDNSLRDRFVQASQVVNGGWQEINLVHLPVQTKIAGNFLGGDSSARFFRLVQTFDQSFLNLWT